MRHKKQQSRENPQKPTKLEVTSHTSELTFLEHVSELRARLFWVVLTIIAAAAAGFQFKDLLTHVVMAPLDGQKLVYLTPGGGFGFIFTIVIYFGVLVAIPVIVYHIYRFLQPLLQEASRKLIVMFMLLSCALAIGGAAFGYFVTIPAALHFLASFAGDAVTPNLTADSYLNFVVAYVLGLAVLFQLPLLLFFFDHVRPFPPGTLMSTQRFVIIGATIVAAVITPTPDAFNMAIVAVPIIAIYQVGAIAVYIRHRALAKRRAESHVPSVPAAVETPVAIAVSEPASAVRQNISDPDRGSRRVQPSPRPAKPNVRPKVIDGFVRTQPAGNVAARKNVPPRRPSRSIDGFNPATSPSNS